jgi:hypothetical protein
MAKAVLVCTRDPAELPDDTALRRIAERLTPEGIEPRPPIILSDRGVRLLIINPPPSQKYHRVSAYLGLMLKPESDWWAAASAVPDGTFALFRTTPEYVELVTDTVATRTIWYVHTDRMLVAATSQRAIISVLGDLRLNRSALAWFLSSGTLGPTDAWDERIRRVPADGRVVLNRTTWGLSQYSVPVTFSPELLGREEWYRTLYSTLTEVVSAYNWNEGEWWLPLSGGYDSRCLLVLLQEKLRPTCVTWGLRSSLAMPYNDAYVARQLAEYYHLPHEYYETEVAPEPVSTLVRRFLTAGEGCSAELYPYLDGFSAWREIYRAGAMGVIRGDEAFGWVQVLMERHARISVGLSMLHDYYTPDAVASFELPTQTIPESLCRCPQESLGTYRDRLYHAFRIPIGLAGLNDLKAGHVEIANPLLSGRVVRLVRRLPEEFRTGKALYASIVKNISPPIPFAKFPADDARNSYLSTESFGEYIRNQLGSKSAVGLLPGIVREGLSRQTKVGNGKLAGRLVRLALKRLMPLWLVRRIRAVRGPDILDRSILALRVAMAVELINMLNEDATTRDSISPTPEPHHDKTPRGGSSYIVS